MQLVTNHSSQAEMKHWIEQGESCFKLICSRHQTLDYWSSEFETEPFEMFDTLALSSYLKALEEGWNPETPLPDHYELYESPHRQPLYLNHLKQEGIIYLSDVQLQQEETEIRMVCRYTKERDPLGESNQTLHHQQMFRLDLAQRQLFYWNSLNLSDGWQLIPRHDYLPLPQELKKTQGILPIGYRPRWLTIYDRKIEPMFQLISLMMTQFHHRHYPLPTGHSLITSRPCATTFLDCLKQMHLIHYQTTSFTSLLLDEWVTQTPTALLLSEGIKPNPTFKTLLETSLDHLTSIIYLKQRQFTTHEIALLLKPMNKGSRWFIRMMEQPWIQSLLAAQGTKDFCQHWFHAHRPIGELIRDIDRQYRQIQKLLDPLQFNQVAQTWSYQVSFERFEHQLIQTFTQYQPTIQKQPFTFQTPWIQACFDSGRCLFQDDSLRLMIPESEAALVTAGEQYRMCFGSYLPDILKEKLFIFFIEDAKQELKGAVRLVNDHQQWSVVEVKRTYNRQPSEELIDWLQAIAQQYQWEWKC